VWRETAVLDLGGQPDTLTWEDEHHLLVAVHTSAVAFLLHALTNGRRASGSRVFRVDVTTRPLSAELLFDDDGDRLSAVSSAVRLGERLYLGQVLRAGIGVARRAD
jgi:hypothetical protein